MKIKLALVIILLVTVGCKIESHDSISWQFTQDPNNPAVVKWDSKVNSENSKLADQLGLRWLEVTCVAKINRDPYIFLHGRPTAQLLQKRGTWPPGVTYVDIMISDTIKPDEYWSGIKPADVFCPGFSFDWQDHYSN